MITQFLQFTPDCSAIGHFGRSVVAGRHAIWKLVRPRFLHLRDLFLNFSSHLGRLKRCWCFLHSTPFTLVSILGINTGQGRTTIWDGSHSAALLGYRKVESGEIQLRRERHFLPLLHVTENLSRTLSSLVNTLSSFHNWIRRLQLYHGVFRAYSPRRAFTRLRTRFTSCGVGRRHRSFVIQPR